MVTSSYYIILNRLRKHDGRKDAPNAVSRSLLYGSSQNTRSTAASRFAAFHNDGSADIFLNPWWVACAFHVEQQTMAEVTNRPSKAMTGSAATMRFRLSWHVAYLEDWPIVENRSVRGECAVSRECSVRASIGMALPSLRILSFAARSPPPPSGGSEVPMIVAPYNQLQASTNQR